jgi:homoaconitase/3-isopropylmalate dehydratase large subunit
MSIEAGARVGLIAPDETTFAYLKGWPLAPTGAEWDAAVAYWKSIRTDPDAMSDLTVAIDAKDIEPTVSWGTSPQDVVRIGGIVPNPEDAKDDERKRAMKRALEYMGLEAGTKMEDIRVIRCISSKVFSSVGVRDSFSDLGNRCSSALAPMRASRTYDARPRLPAVGRSSTTSMQWLSPARVS